jgi:hypothetical protein
MTRLTIRTGWLVSISSSSEGGRSMTCPWEYSLNLMFVLIGFFIPKNNHIDQTINDIYKCFINQFTNNQ